MTERFTETVATGIVTDALTGKEYNCEMRIDDDFLNLVNTIAEENKQLKQEYQKLKHRHSLLHDVCIEAECDRDSYHKDVLSLEKENEQLKKENKELRQYLSWQDMELEEMEDLND